MKKKDPLYTRGFFFHFQNKKNNKSSKKFTMWENVLITNLLNFELH